MKIQVFYLSTLLFCLLGVSNTVSAQYIFDPNYIHDIEIDFYDADWDHKLDSLASLNSGTGSGTGRILADVTIDGNPYDSCGVRYKGNSSMDTTSNKNPYNIDLNYVIPGQEHQGKDKIKLANCFTDPSMIREALTYELANQYMDCPRASFTKLTINGNYIGLYTNTESIDNEFLKEHYGSSKNPFFKCDPVSFDIFGDNSNLAYHPDTMAYDTLYDMKSLWGLEELQTLTWNLENNAANIDQYLDVDRALWFLAVSSAFVHNDGYTAFAHNFYVYKQDNGRWSIVLWDVNMAFGGLLWNGTNLLPLGTPDLQSQDPFLHAADPNFRPLIAQLLSIPQYNKIYVAHYRTIMEENVNNGYYLSRAEWWNNLIDADVPLEPYPFYSYQDFQDNLYTDVGVWFDMRPGLENLMSARETYIYSLPEFQYIQPDISNVTAPTLPPPFTTVNVTADVSNETSVTLAYRYNQFDVFTKVPMFDDGLHGDGAAADGTYGGDLPLLALDVQYYIYAENSDAAKFSPVRAEYEFYTITPEKGLVINELSANNVSIATDLAGEYDDWIELYNNTAGPINLADYYLSDASSNLFKWNLPNFSLPAGEYFIVWADNQTGQSGVHANFALNSSGEGLYLSTVTDSIIDMVDYPSQDPDITWARLPNGTGPFNYMFPTFGMENTTLASTEELNEENEMVVYPNPASTVCSLRFEKSIETSFNVYNFNGQVVSSGQISGSSYQLDVSDFGPGAYIIMFASGQAEKLIVR